MHILHVSDQDQRWKMAQDDYFHDVLSHIWTLMMHCSKRIA